MRLTCLQDNLARGLAIVGRAVGGRGSLDVLTHVLLRAEAGRLELTATNLELALVTHVGAKVVDDGAIAVPAKLLTELVQSLQPGPVELTANVRTRALRVKNDRHDTEIKGADAMDFPTIPRVSEPATLRMSQAELLRTIGSVAFAAAPDDSRAVLTGVGTRVRENAVTMAASDGYRLAVRRSTLISIGPDEFDLVLPARSLLELARLLQRSEDVVDIVVGPQKSHILFRFGDVELMSRIIEGTYVNYDPVIPTIHSARAVVQRADLLEAVRVASYFARETANVVQLELWSDERQAVIVSAPMSETGTSVGRLDASVEGKSTRIGFNSRFMTDALESTQGTEVVIELGGPLAPCVMRVPDDESFLYVLMPIRTAA